MLGDGGPALPKAGLVIVDLVENHDVRVVHIGAASLGRGLLLRQLLAHLLHSGP